MRQVFVHYRLTAGLGFDAASADLACLSADERERGSRLVFPADRRDFFAAHVLLRRSLTARAAGDPASWSFVGSSTGKPHLANRGVDQPLTFNLSHTRGLVACAVAYGEEVGIDVEPIAAAPDLLDLARANFSAAEVAELERCVPAHRPSRFTGMWTLKEAYLKATGAGIATGLDEMTVNLEGALPLVSVNADGSERTDDWHVLLMDLPGYRLAAAVRARGERVRFVVDEPPQR